MGWNDRVNLNGVSDEAVRQLLATAPTAISLDWADHEFPFLPNDSAKASAVVGIGVVDEVVGHSVDDLGRLRHWLSATNDLVMGYFSYGVKDLLENLTSENPDRIGFPLFHFFVPEKVLVCIDGNYRCFSHEGTSPISPVPISKEAMVGKPLSLISKAEQIERVQALKNHIQLGDIYEVNFCVEHGFRNTTVEPHRLYRELQERSPAPFSCYVADDGKYLIGSSPERFMQKVGNRLVSQPMKGTNRRTADNELQKAKLSNDAKEVAENVMITDLVRNDISRSAKKGTVKVDELCGIYEFRHVNQMISTVSAELRDDVHPLDALLNAFPMGSMTGAPKIRAMELIDRYEDFSRGLYSGAVGYFTPDLDFDFNVVIRSILYNKEKEVVTFPTGSAITIHSDPEMEFEECMLKAEAMRNVLLNHAR